MIFLTNNVKQPAVEVKEGDTIYYSGNINSNRAFFAVKVDSLRAAPNLEISGEFIDLAGQWGNHEVINMGWTNNRKIFKVV